MKQSVNKCDYCDTIARDVFSNCRNCGAALFSKRETELMLTPGQQLSVEMNAFTERMEKDSSFRLIVLMGGLAIASGVFMRR